MNKIIAPVNNSNAVNIIVQNANDSIEQLKKVLNNLSKNHINFNTFNAKIKVDYEDNDGKQPDITAFVRIVKDSAIWISLNATIISLEVFRVLITKDSVKLLNKQKKQILYRSINYLQDLTQVPFDFNTLQDFIVGNPIFVDSNIVSYKVKGDVILISTLGKFFKNLITLSNSSSPLIMHSKLDDINVDRNRTADITYKDFENLNGQNFSTYREVTVSEKNKLEIQMTYKQYDFNKILSLPFLIPKNFKKM